MTALAWMFLAAIPIAWALTSLSYAIQNRRDERDWQAMVDEADEQSQHWRTKHHAADIANDGLRKTLAKAETELAEQADRVFPAAPRPGANLRVVPEVERLDALLAERAAVVPIAKKRGGGKAVRSS